MKNWKRFLAGFLSVVMVISLCTGVGVIWNLSKENALAAGIVDASGLFTIPTSAGELGSETNPFVVLEIVPNENMAQFGYLVDGQEPIDLITAMTGTDKTEISTALANYLTVNLESDTPYKQEFSDLISEEEWGEYYWKYYVNANQYGYFEKLADNSGDYKLQMTEEYVEVGAGNGDYDYVKCTTGSEAPIVEGMEYYSEVTEGTGLFSDAKYVSSENSGEYSLTYKKVADGTGDYIYSEGKDYYETKNYIYYQWDYSLKSHPWFVTFKYVGNDNADGQQTYSIKNAFSDNIYNNWNVYTKYYRRNYNGKYEYATSNPKYYVIFEPDEDGDYVVEGATSFDSTASQAWKQYSMLYDHIYEAPGWNNVGSNGNYTTHTSEIPQYVGSTIVKGSTVYLGEYNKVMLEEKQIVTGDNQIGSQNYDKYVFQEKDGGAYQKVYTYTIVPTKAGTGNYQWVGYDYATSSTATSLEYTNKVVSDKPLNEDDAKLTQIKAYKENLSVYSAYQGSKTNNELFKKYALGLAYKDNDYTKGEDTAAYKFIGWYTEPECVNTYNKSDAITSDITLYAKWEIVYSTASVANNYSISFDKNAGSDEVLNMPETIGYLNMGDQLVKPNTTPLREGYVFTGWYTESECTNEYDFTASVNESKILYAGWRTLEDTTYALIFNSNAGVGNEGSVTNMPAVVSDLKKNGRRSDFSSAKPATDPVREGYIFGGWYWNKACTNRFTFDVTIADEVSDYNINLYAKWIAVESVPKHSVTFMENKPSTAIAPVKGLPATITGITFGDSLEENFPENVPSLKGNIVEKLANYQVKVITVTPKDFDNQAENLQLIDRANLIVLNQSCNSAIRSYWNSYKNTELFSKPTTQYNITADTFVENDLSWTATMRLFHKVTGAKDTDMCPVIYDYSIYTSVIGNSSIRQSVNFRSTFSDSSAFQSGSNYGYSSNVYKLYLMTQQINPVTLYNAYLKNNIKIDSNGNFTGGTSTDAKVKKYWNNYTLIPYAAISSSDWDSTQKKFLNNALDVIGVSFDVELATDISAVNNRMLLYQNSTNMVAGFISPVLSSTGMDEMNAFMCPSGDSQPVSYTTAEVLYYLLHNQELYQNFNKNLNILEIEPSDSYKSDTFWFWYISRYVPNFTGSLSVNTMNSSEFIGDIKDLNSTYDAIYMGVDASKLVTSFMPNSIETTTVPANTEVTIGTAQVINSAFQKKVITTTSTSSYEASRWDGPGFHSQGATIAIKINEADQLVLDYDSLGNDKTWLELKISSKIGNYWNSKYKYKCQSQHGDVYLEDIKVYSDKYSWMSSYFSEDDNGNILRKDERGNWRRGFIYLEKYYWKETTTTTTQVSWVDYPAGSTVAVGDVIKFPSGGSYTYTSGSYYTYAHVGAQVESKKTRRGSFDSVNDTIDQYLYSGNDITNAKYKELLQFALAGYPVIFSKDIFLSNGSINTGIIDTASYIYQFINELQTNATYSSASFIENDTTRDAEFITALQNKSFNLVVLNKPVEYVDRTLPAYSSYTDDKVYINGASDGSDSRIDEKSLEYTFKIDTTDTGYYEVRLYIDTNADGKFSETEEKLDSLEIVNTRTNKTTRANKLVGGQTYQITRQILDYVGAIPWKLEVVDLSNSLVRDDVTGQCAIKVATKTKINVLQIISDGFDGGSSYAPTVYFPTEKEVEAAIMRNSNRRITDSGVDVSNYFSGVIDKVNTNSKITDSTIVANAGWFYYYTQILNEFEVEFFRLSVTELSTLVNTGVAPNDSTIYLQNGKCTYLEEKDINMLILGYADCYSDITNEKALQLIDNFISAGNTTLFTHDTTSFVNLSSKPASFSDVYWGYNINQYFREMLGMDRFGVMKNKGIISNLSNASDKPYAVNTLQSDHIFYTANGTNVGTRVLTQGMTNVTVGQDGTRVTQATKANDGQIVTYPYTIPDSLTVASTHSQYYQLDMEADDIVVWYCLTGTNDYYKTNNDVRNNYYIYNRGNITYSGVGHSGGLSDSERKLFVNTMIAAYTAGTVPTEPVITNRDKSSSDSFVDYLYVDYDASVDVNEAKPFGDEIHSYTSGSETIYTKRVYFTLRNYSIIMNKRMTVHYYPVVTVTSGGTTTKKVLTECPMLLTTYEYDSDTDTGTQVRDDTFEYTYTYSDGSSHTENVTGGVVESGYEYYVDVPISDSYYASLISGDTDELEDFALDSNSSFEMQIQVVMRYGREEANNTPLVGKRNAVFMRRGMFTLD